mmetsp:Transcript_11127/g.30110  ORF Transcript_11127/g.30110 Transcript_11127/m.30110 type:complete len:231 (+) Transcript_11127:1254-1946(+)
MWTFLCSSTRGTRAGADAWGDHIGAVRACGVVRGPFSPPCPSWLPSGAPMPQRLTTSRESSLSCHTGGQTQTRTGPRRFWVTMTMRVCGGSGRRMRQLQRPAIMGGSTTSRVAQAHPTLMMMTTTATIPVVSHCDDVCTTTCHILVLSSPAASPSVVLCGPRSAALLVRHRRADPADRVVVSLLALVPMTMHIVCARSWPSVESRAVYSPRRAPPCVGAACGPCGSGESP